MKYYNIYFRFKVSKFLLTPKFILYIINIFHIKYARITEYIYILYAILPSISKTLNVFNNAITVNPIAFANNVKINTINNIVKNATKNTKTKLY